MTYEEDECNGICLTAADIGLSEFSRTGEVAYAHPDCPAHLPLSEDCFRVQLGMPVVLDASGRYLARRREGVIDG
jgi:hypothetical protein